MKSVPAGLAASLASGVTTVARCWRLERQDGVVLGFTDHDETITFGGTDYRPGTGMTASQWTQTTGLAVDTMEALGALSDDSLTEDDLAKGLWDGAKVQIWLVDWTDPSERLLMQMGSTGEVSRGPLEFRAELRSLAHALNQSQGRTYSVLCDADLGDARCGVDLTDPAFRAEGTVTGITSNRGFTASGLDAFEAGWFTRGLLTWTSGENAGLKGEVKRHTTLQGQPYLELVLPMPFDIVPGSPGDAFTVTAGCDKTTGVCHAKFANIANHRGFPFMVGNDFVTRYPVRSDGNTGGALQSGGGGFIDGGGVEE